MKPLNKRQLTKLEKLAEQKPTSLSQAYVIAIAKKRITKMKGG